MSRIGNSIGEKVDEWLPGTRERREREVTASGCGVYFGVMKIFWT